MNLEIGNLTIKIENYDLRNRYLGKKEFTDCRMHYRYVNNANTASQNIKNSFREFKILSSRGMLKEIYLLTDGSSNLVERLEKQEVTLSLAQYRVRMIIFGISPANIQSLLSALQVNDDPQFCVVQKKESTKDICPLRSEILSSQYYDIISPVNERIVDNGRKEVVPEEGDKENQPSNGRMNQVKGKLRFSELLKDCQSPDNSSNRYKSGYTPEVKRSIKVSNEGNRPADIGFSKSDFSPPVAPPAPVPSNNSFETVFNKVVTKRVMVPKPPMPASNPTNSQHSTRIVRNLNNELALQKENPTSSSSTNVLSTEQDAILQRCLNGESLFITGGGGSGKSTLLKSIIEELKTKYDRRPSSSSSSSAAAAVHVLATTGLAAFAINGITIHQYLTLPLLDLEQEITVDSIQCTIKKVLSFVYICYCLFLVPFLLDCYEENYNTTM
jgi:hypothetical protein